MKFFVPFSGNVADDSGGRNYAQSFIAEIRRDDRGHEWVVGADPVFLERLGTPPGTGAVTFLRFPEWSRSSTGKVLFEQIKLPGVARAVRPDAVFFPNNFATLATGIPHLLSIRSTVYYHYPEQVTRVRRLTRRVITAASVKRATALMCPSEDIARDLVKFLGVARERIQVVYHGINPAFLKPDPKHEELLERLRLRGKKYFVYPSALWEYKNQSTLIRAMQQLSTGPGEGFALVLAGKGIATESGYVQELERLAAEVKAPFEVLMPGHLSAPELNVLYSHAVATLFPSTYESFGNPVVESMARGCPVLVSDRHALPEIAGPGGQVLPARDPAAWAKAMLEFASDPDLRERYARAATARSRDFSFEKAVNSVVGILERIAYPSREALVREAR